MTLTINVEYVIHEKWWIRLANNYFSIIFCAIQRCEQFIKHKNWQIVTSKLKFYLLHFLHSTDAWRQLFLNKKISLLINNFIKAWYSHFRTLFSRVYKKYNMIFFLSYLCYLIALQQLFQIIIISEHNELLCVVTTSKNQRKLLAGTILLI